MIVIKVKYLKTIASMMQRSRGVVDSRCKVEGLFIYLGKTEVLLFIIKKKTEGVVSFEYQSVKLNLSKEFEYPGNILGDKLMWKATREDVGEERAKGFVSDVAKNSEASL